MGKKKANQAKLDKDAAHCIKEQIAIIQRYLKQTDFIIAILIKLDFAKDFRGNNSPIDDDIKFSVQNLILGLGISTNSLCILSSNPGLPTRDCYPLARTILETAVNICYILAAGVEAAKNAIDHANQKAYKDLDRTSIIGDSAIKLIFSGEPTPEDAARLRVLVDQYTSRSGREKGWTDLNIDQRIDFASKRFGNNFLAKLHFARFIVYRHSSEIIHGTLFGSLFFLGLTNPTRYSDIKEKGMKEFSEQIGVQNILILMATIFSLSAVIDAFHSVYGFPEGYKESKAYISEMYKIPWFAKIVNKGK